MLASLQSDGREDFSVYSNVVFLALMYAKKSIVLNMENKMLYSRVQFSQIIERAGQGNRNWKLVIKISADLNRNRFLFQCQVHINAS